jgi:hypothetical protein
VSFIDNIIVSHMLMHFHVQIDIGECLCSLLIVHMFTINMLPKKYVTKKGKAINLNYKPYKCTKVIGQV